MCLTVEHSGFINRNSVILRNFLFLLLQVIVMRAFSVHTLTCHPSAIKIGNECCPMCPAGSRVEIGCTCLPCTDGSYTDKLNGLKQCSPCRICDSGGGLKVEQPCTAASDTVCEPVEGFFCIHSTKSSCAAAQTHSSCEPGQYISTNGTSSSDTECSDCRDGTFSDGASSSCQPHTQCESKNLQQIKAGTSSSDAECGEKSSSLTPAAVVGIILVVLLLIATVVLLILHRKKKLSLISGKQRNAANHRDDRRPGGTTDQTEMSLSQSREDG
ncbi:tumor necrosis factor receptor superfamily member 14-like isoform X1 [Melanotaenia boesemani]|uniref:tumor necrosis factor receptor superfamily member 14-like isoform X1 n=1 Tax=Melanotaenia boesemani TaxID=1250792 RepID=UPI001C05BE41|nr:tumor necrosis factor receptor superfamily member 14-like isoform X1 [Melanotaenia boesemani]XP_041859102.1 tumor necrosis factor receptor superfamily member 14-like isoform X1 [Melanotaenia boesemani]XP_041859103.1 tumor necrosis factor receptor superfamily member 14-like isoform X1 [Melanotaenia boesemani]XP_041859104.1 tumor necrosis factor receptor superfamily member 14-like isoform X1 [Melanotaenia boesemani]